MSSDEKSDKIVILFIFGGLALGCFLFYCIGHLDGKKAMQREAIKNHVAHFEVDESDEMGRKDFKWNTTQPALDK